MSKKTTSNRPEKSTNRLKKATAKPMKLSKESPSVPLSRTIRETIESIVIAFILAFLFRTFEAEAFVIPTGSMAPTLQGMHKELECENCGFRYKVSASSESGEDRPPTMVIGSTCPNCRYRQDGIVKRKGFNTYNGDRILVSKFAYEIGDPQRWDVFVFRFPGNAKMNYIKRLVGLPNETLKIENGDLYRRPFDVQNPTKHDQDPFQIIRKPPDKVRAMLQTVYDNDYFQPTMHKNGWPKRWQAGSTDDRSGWQEIDDGKSFQIASQEANPSWLRYHHIVPTSEAWEGAEGGVLSGNRLAKSRLIADFYAYNTTRTPPIKNHRGENISGENVPVSHWVGDLGIEMDLESTDGKGTVTLQLIEGGNRFECVLNMETGKAMLAINAGDAGFTPANDDSRDKQPESVAQVVSDGSQHIRFANVDDQLLLWIDDDLVEFDRPTTYDGIKTDKPSAFNPDDRAPAAIGAAGSAITVSHLKVLRDGYYISDRVDRRVNTNSITDYDPEDTPHPRSDFLANPGEWSQTDLNKTTLFDRRRPQIFDIGPEQFFAMGDNSPSSLDGRLWGDKTHRVPYVVDRHLLIGKALYIYWPRSLDYFPLCPNFPRMGFVR